MIRPTDTVIFYAAAALIALVLALGTWLSIERQLHAATRGKLSAAVSAHAAAVKHEIATARTWELATLELQGELARSQAQWQTAQATAAAATAAAASAREQAKRDQAAYDAIWASRPAACAAALSALDRACPDLGVY